MYKKKRKSHTGRERERGGDVEKRDRRKLREIMRGEEDTIVDADLATGTTRTAFSSLAEVGGRFLSPL